jgi:hypothetical protein
MFSIRLGINVRVIFISIFDWLLNKPTQHKHKTHDFTEFTSDRDYVFEKADDITKGYITGQGKGIKPGDFILLRQGEDSCCYQVEQIDYYSDPPDMWMALVARVTRE